MDNRQDNLCLVHCTQQASIVAMETPEVPSRKNSENSLYWVTMLQLMNDPNEQVSLESSSL
jgi:hypothetical protein